MRTSPVAGSGLGEVVRQAVPPWLVPVVVGITYAGSVGVLLALFTADYWFGDRRRGAHALSLGLAGVALITVLKALFAAPRPPEATRLIAATGFGFPSGHATIATIGYGVLAYDLEIGSRPVRYGAASAIVAAIALSRVALGVHFLRDVVAGVTAGIVFLVVAEPLTGHEPGPGFLLAVALGIAAVLVSGASTYSVAELGAITGAATAWAAFEPVPSLESDRERLALVGAGLPVLAVVGYLALFAVELTAAAFLLSLTLMAGVVSAPIPVVYLFRGDRFDAPI